MLAGVCRVHTERCLLGVLPGHVLCRRALWCVVPAPVVARSALCPTDVRCSLLGDAVSRLLWECDGLTSQAFIKRCLTPNLDRRPDVKLLSEDPYLSMRLK
jgi:hypothetical protein